MDNKDTIAAAITAWAKKNVEDGETANPSWNVDALAKHLAGSLPLHTMVVLAELDCQLETRSESNRPEKQIVAAWADEIRDCEGVFSSLTDEVLDLLHRKVNNQEYELTTLSSVDTNADVSEERTRSLVEELGGEIKSVQYEGARRLAYPINKEDKADYHFYNITLNPANINKFAQRMNGRSDTMRYLLFKTDKALRKSA